MVVDAGKLEQLDDVLILARARSTHFVYREHAGLFLFEAASTVDRFLEVHEGAAHAGGHVDLGGRADGGVGVQGMRTRLVLCIDL